VEESSEGLEAGVHDGAPYLRVDPTVA
jgi:hypothetical protein